MSGVSRTCLGFLVAAVTLALPLQARAEGSPPPVLRIDDPFAGPIWKAAIDRDGTTIAVASAAKSISVWTIGKTASLATLRLPMRNEQKRRAHAIALSPDGQRIAYSVPLAVQEQGNDVPDSSRIYVVERASGIIKAVIGTEGGVLPSRPQGLAFSPDGEYLAAVLSSGCGLRVFSKTGALIAEDDDGYAGEGAASDFCQSDTKPACDPICDSSDAQFVSLRDGTLAIVATSDTGVRLYRKTGETFALNRSVAPKDLGLERPSGIALSPDGHALAIGDKRDRTKTGPMNLKVAIVSAETLSPILSEPLAVDTRAVVSSQFIDPGPNLGDVRQSSIERVTWVTNGGDLFVFAGGALSCFGIKSDLIINTSAKLSERELCMARWRVGDAGAELDDPSASPVPQFIPVGTDRVRDLLGKPSGDSLFIVSEQMVGLYDADGQPVIAAEDALLDARRRAADLRDPELDFKISPDARTISFTDYAAIRTPGSAERYVTFDLRTLKVTDEPQAHSSATIGPDSDTGQAIITGWRNAQGAPPKIVGNASALPDHSPSEVFRSLALLPAQQRLILGSSEFLRVIGYGDSTVNVQCRLPISEDAYRVNVTADGRVVVAGHADGTLRWYRITKTDDGRCTLTQLLSVYLARNRINAGWTWIAWQPNGTFAQGADAQPIMVWQLQDDGRQPSVVRFDKLPTAYYDSGAIKGSLDILPEPRLEKTDAGVAVSAKELAQAVATPVIRPDMSDLGFPRTEKVKTWLEISDAKGWPLNLDVRVGDNLPVFKSFAGKRYGKYEEIPIDKHQLDEGAVEIEIELPGKVRTEHKLFPVCFLVRSNADSDSQTDKCVASVWKGETVQLKRRLWAIFAGIAKNTASEKMSLRYATNDVADLATLFLDDFAARNSKTEASSEFSSLNISLIASPPTPQSAREIAELAKRQNVRVFEPTRAGLYQALEDVVQRILTAADAEEGDDLFLFHFSGHGVVFPFGNAGGSSVYALSTTPYNASAEALKSTAFTNLELISWLRRIPARKIVILDACRSVAPLEGATIFDPGRVRQEFSANALDADFIFSSQEGQESLEFQGLASTEARLPADQGSSLFNYGLMRALTSPEAGFSADGRKSSVQIDIGTTWRYLKRVFFSSSNPKSEINKLRSRLKDARLETPPQPVIVPARDDPSVVLRTLTVKQ